MCFSASASFLASGVLTVAGVMAYKQVQHTRQYLFASIPFLFAMQQAAEGIVWLSFAHSALEPWRVLAAYLFLFVAFIVWPVWMPVSIYLLEPHKRVLLKKLLIGAGVIASAYLALGLMTHTMIPHILDCHIRYSFPNAHPKLIISSVLYVLATIGSFLFASRGIMQFTGLLLAIAYVVSAIGYYHAFVSVWCFFAALLSVGVFLILYKSKRS